MARINWPKFELMNFKRLGSMKLQSKLVLSFLLISLLIGLSGGSGLYFVNRIANSLDVYTEVSTPLVAEATGLLDGMKNEHVDLLTALSATDVSQVKASNKKLKEFSAAAQERLNKLGQMVKSSGSDVSLEEAAARQAKFIKQAKRALRVEQQAIAKAGETVAQLEDFEAARIKLAKSLAQFARNAEAIMSGSEDASKTWVQYGGRDFEEMNTLLNDTFHVAYPQVQGGYKLIAFLADLQNIARAYTAETDLAKLNDIENQFKKGAKRFSKRLKRLERRVGTEEGKAALNSIKTGFNDLEFNALFDVGLFATYRDSLESKLEADKLRAAMGKTADAYQLALVQVFDKATELNKQVSNDTASGVREALLAIGIVVLGGMLLGLVFGFVLSRGIANPLNRITAVTGQLADGDLDVEIPGSERGDEIGSLAKAVEVFKQNGIEKTRLEREREEAQAEEQRTLREQATRDSKIQADIDATVQAAVAGDFSQRVDTTSTEGVMRNLSEGMNKLLEIVDRGLNDTVTVVSSMSQGDLTKGIDGEYQGSFATLKDDTNRMGEQMREIAGKIIFASAAVDGATAEIASGVSDLSTRTEHQASSLEETTASMEELSATVRQNADNAQEANQVAAAARDSATNGGEVVGQAVSAMSRIEDSSKQITDIVGLIQEIAFQTNLLALNAAVEAARAGDAGKGFAVVANEVRALAQRAGQASKDIKDLISNSDNQVKEGVELVNKAGTSLEEIVGSVKKVADFVSEIAAASQEQSAGIDQVSRAINSMEEMTQQNGALVEETTAALQSAQSQVGDLRDVVAFFKTGEEAMMMAKAEQAKEAAEVDHPVHQQQSTVRRAVAGGAATATADDADWQEF